MKSLKYIALIGLLCAGLTTLSRANLIDLGQGNLGNNSDATELAGFIAAGGASDSQLVFKQGTPGFTTLPFAGGFITFSVNANDTLHVIWDMTGTGGFVTGFLTKDGDAHLVHYYSVTADQALSGSGDLIVPGNGADSLSHLDVFADGVNPNPQGTGVPDGGTTLMLLGAALGSLGMARRFLKR